MLAFVNSNPKSAYADFELFESWSKNIIVGREDLSIVEEVKLKGEEQSSHLDGIKTLSVCVCIVFPMYFLFISLIRSVIGNCYLISSVFLHYRTRKLVRRSNTNSNRSDHNVRNGG